MDGERVTRRHFSARATDINDLPDISPPRRRARMALITYKLCFIPKGAVLEGKARGDKALAARRMVARATRRAQGFEIQARWPLCALAPVALWRDLASTESNR